MPDNDPYLVATKPLKPSYNQICKIQITCDNFTLGRALNNAAVIPFLSISRNHCIFRKSEHDEWTIEDNSAFGIKVNGDRLGRGVKRKLSHDDIITLEPSQEFVYRFVDPSSDLFEIPRKRIKLEPNLDEDLIKLKFEESQSYEIKHIEEKIHNAQQMQTASIHLKDKLQLGMNRKIKQLESDFKLQIESLKGEKNEVEKHKALLIEERDAQLAAVREEMEGKIKELMDQIIKHNNSESELLKENNLLKERLLKDREEFMSELNRESSSKQDLMEKLEAKFQEQEEIRLKEKQELEEQLKRETELLRQAKEQEIKELEEQKKKREEEFIKEMNEVKEILDAQIKETTKKRIEVEQEFHEQVDQLKKLSDEDKVKMEQLIKDREEVQRQLQEAQANAQKLIEEAKAKVHDREIELAAIASERIQKEAQQSIEVISSLQEQLEKLRNELQSVETEKNTLLEALVAPDNCGEGTSNQTTLDKVGEVMESELQCSICAELFICAITLNCSHTFCKYCITMWKKKKKDCPICRAPVTSECRSLVLDSFIEKMVQNLSEEMKKKREELLKFREELDSELARGLRREDSWASSSYVSDADDDDELVEEEEEYEDHGYGDDFGYGDGDEYDEYEEYEDYNPWQRHYYDTDSDSGSDHDSDASSPAATGAAPANGDAATGADAAADGAAAANGAAAAADSVRSTAGVPNSTAERPNRAGGRRPHGIVPGRPGSFYGGYGRCYHCNRRGHWAPGCPFR